MEKINTDAKEWKLNLDAELQGSSAGFWYDINEGYIELEKVLTDPEQIVQAQQAVAILASLERALEDNNLLNLF